MRYAHPVKVAVALLLTSLGLTACGASIGGPQASHGDDQNTSPDARPSGDGSTVTLIDAPITPACANGRAIYLNFDGATLKRGASDATTDHASWVGVGNPNVTQGTLPKYHANSGTRTADIQTIVDAVKAYVAATPIPVVTQRPAAGPYVMVVFGGEMDAIGVPYSIAVNDLDCGDTIKSDVAWVSDSTDLAKVPGFAIGGIGYGLGLTATNDANDCMCGWDNQCQQTSSACTLSAQIASDNRCATTTQNETAAFAAFCTP